MYNTTATLNLNLNIKKGEIMLFAQIAMSITLLLMISGKTPLYTTAIIGSFISSLIAGFSLTSGDGVTIVSLINGGLNPVIADMAGVLMFIGVMQACGFMDIIIRFIIKIGRVLGGGAGVALAGGVAAGIIGMLTGFTQPAVTAVITGVASTKLGITPNQSAAIHAHAGHLGNYGGFTHPTQVSVVAITGIGFGLINLVGIFVSLSIFVCSFLRAKITNKNSKVILSKEEILRIASEFENSENSHHIAIAFLPFLFLFIGFIFGYPIFILGVLASILAIILAKFPFAKGENAMLDGVSKIATPLVATIGFLFMSGVIKNIGLADIIGNLFLPILTYMPIQTMLLVSALAGLITQSNSASMAITIPFLHAVLGVGADPFAAACVAAGGSAIMQYFLTGGPIAALATVVPLIPGSDLKLANKFQRPSMLFGLFVLFLLSFVL